jgi:RHS repeat-associated protein
MFEAAKWFDPVIGIDIHIIQPPGPVPPVPVPHPFIGIVFDPIGVAVTMAISGAMSGLFGGPFKGPVFINGMPAAHTGTQVIAEPMHIPIGGVFVVPPSNDGTIITGSKTVYIYGSSAARLTSIVITCNDPVNLPTSVVLAIPMGRPVLIGGPPALDVLAAVLSAIRTQWVSDYLHKLFKIKPGSWLSKTICFLTGHPVDVVTGRVLTDHVDFTLPGPIPFQFERHYYSASTYQGPLGHGWHHSYDQYIAIRGDSIILRAEDGRDIEFDAIAEGESIYEPVERLDLARQSNRFFVRTADRRVLHFGPGTRSDGTYPLTGIADHNDHAIRLEYSGDRLVSIVDSSGRRLQLVNDWKGRVVSLQAPDPDSGSSPLTVARFEYDLAGDLVAAYDAFDHAYHYAYRNHLLVQETDRNGLSFYFQYDDYTPEGWCVRTWGDGGIFDHKLTYHKTARITVVENSLGAKTTYVGNEVGLVSKIIDDLGIRETFEWDAWCRKVAETDANGNTTRFAYDPRGNLTSIRYPDGTVVEAHCNPGGELTQFTDPAGHRWDFARDERGRLTQFRTPLGATWRLAWARDRETLTNPLGKEHQTRFDGQGNPVLEVGAHGGEIRCQYDSLGRLCAREGPGGARFEYGYDRKSRLIESRLPSGRTIQFQYDPMDRLIGVVNEARGTLRIERAPSGVPARVVRADGSEVNYHFNSESDLVAVSNETGAQFQILRDARGRPVEEVDFWGNRRQFSYDQGAKATTVTGESNLPVRLVEDALGQIVERRLPDGSAERFQYDKVGRLLAAENASGKVERSYDPDGLLVREVQRGFEIGHQYDACGRRVERKSSAGNTLRFRHDAIGRLVGLEVNGRPILTASYLESAPAMQETFFGSIQRTSTWNADGQMTSDRVVGRRGIVFELFCEYDMAGRVSRFRDTFTDWTPVMYDAAGRCYDPRDGTPAPPCRGRPELPGYVYDAGGRLIERSGPDGRQILSWDALGRLSGARTGKGEALRFAYDPLGRRAEKEFNGETVRFYWDELNLLAEATPAGTREYIFYPEGFYPLAIIEPDGEVLIVQADFIGLPRTLFNASGEVVWRGEYNAQGELQREPVRRRANPLRFQGQYFDAELGLSYNVFRYFDPRTCAYISCDPLGLDAGHDLYSYAPNVWHWVDPLGLKQRCTLDTSYHGPSGDWMKGLHGHVGPAEYKFLWEDGQLVAEALFNRKGCTTKTDKIVAEFLENNRAQIKKAASDMKEYLQTTMDDPQWANVKEAAKTRARELKRLIKGLGG